MAEISTVENILKKSGQKLREHQVEGLKYLLKCFDSNHGCILADEMGLGKTCQCAVLLEILEGIRRISGRHLIVCPLSVVDHWKFEINRFAPSINLRIFRGTKEEREDLKGQLKRDATQWSCVLTTYELFSKDIEWFQSFTWDSLIVDEAHRLKNQNSLINTNVRQTTIGWIVLLTGTPIQNNLDELYSLMNVVDSHKFNDNHRADFVDKYSKSKNIGELKSTLSQYMLRRTKDTVCCDIPEKGEVVLYHGITHVQKRLYKAILLKNHEAFDSAKDSGKQSLLNTLAQLRKCIDHPYLFEGVEPEPFEEGEHLIEASGKLLVLDALLLHAKREGHKVLLFSQMTRMLDILQDYLAYRGLSYERLDGSVRGEERYAAIDRFNKVDTETFCFLLSTKAGGVGLNLTSADTVVFVDSDFNPQNDIQAAARAHRIGQNKPVKIIRLVGKHTLEEVILARAARKLALTKSIIEEGNIEDKLSAAELTDMLTYGLQQLTTTDDVQDNKSHFDFSSLIGASENGRWMPLVTLEGNFKDEISNGEEAGAETESIYMFEGHDYKPDQVLADKQALQHIISTANNEQSSARRGKAELVAPLTFAPRAAKILTDAELEERKRKRLLAAEKRKQKMEEEREEMEKNRMRKKMNMWKEKGYTSKNLRECEDVGGDEDIDVEPVQAVQPVFVVGDVAQPKMEAQYQAMQAIVVHVVDDSGSWCNGGVFTALSNRSPQPKDAYTLAGKMQDLQLGDAHMVPIDDVYSREGASDFAVLIVAMSRRDRGHIDMEALSRGLRRIAHLCEGKQYTVHLPRIGYGMPKVKWYGIERTIRKILCSKGIPTYIYYFQRRAAEKRKNSDDQDSPNVPMKRNNSEERQSTSATSNGTEVLLDSVFEDYTMFLCAMDDTVANKLTRLIVAFDGQVTNNIEDPNLTHVIVGSHNLDPQISNSVGGLPADVRVVTQAWLDSCIQDKRICPTDIFEYTEEDPYK